MAIWYCSSVGWSAVTAWAASTVQSVGDIRRQLATPAVNDERVFRCTTAGTTGATEPAWVLTKGATTNDGTVVWTEITGDAAYNGPTSFAAPHARMNPLAAWMAAGDSGYVANNHAETVAADISITAPGTAASPNVFLSINPATGLEAPGASITATGNLSQIKISGFLYMKGLAFSSEENSNGFGIHLANVSGNIQAYEGCDFILTNTISLASITVGETAVSTMVDVTLHDCRFKFGSTDQSLRAYGSLDIRGGSILAGSAAITGFLKWGTGNTRVSAIVNVEGFDFTGLATALDLTPGGDPSQNAQIRFSNCKMPAGWTGGLVTAPITSTGTTVDAWNISATDTNYMFWHESFAGSVKQDTGVFMTGGSSDGTTPFSMKMSPSANAEFPGFALHTPEMLVRNETVGTAKTATVEITHSEAADLTDAEVWLEVTYLGTSGFPLSSRLTDRVATVLGTPTAQPASTQAWTGAGTRKQKLEVTFTPQEKGDILWRVALAKASATVYANANLVLA